MIPYLMVGIGGFFGAIARYLVDRWISGRMGGLFPYGTLAINVSGSFILGLFAATITERWIVHPHWSLLIGVGFLIVLPVLLIGSGLFIWLRRRKR